MQTEFEHPSPNMRLRTWTAPSTSATQRLSVRECSPSPETQPDPPLTGTDAKEKAVVAMWEKRANEEGMLPASELFRNTHHAFADRGLPGSAEPIPQVKALRDRALARLGRFFRKFDEQLASNEFVAGPRWTVADATALCAVGFAKWSDVGIPPECGNMSRWYAAVSARPSARRDHPLRGEDGHQGSVITQTRQHSARAGQVQFHAMERFASGRPSVATARTASFRKRTASRWKRCPRGPLKVSRRFLGCGRDRCWKGWF